MWEIRENSYINTHIWRLNVFCTQSKRAHIIMERIRDVKGVCLLSYRALSSKNLSLYMSRMYEYMNVELITKYLSIKGSPFLVHCLPFLH
jgi:hypothetical protein